MKRKGRSAAAEKYTLFVLFFIYLVKTMKKHSRRSSRLTHSPLSMSSASQHHHHIMYVRYEGHGWLVGSLTAQRGKENTKIHRFKNETENSKVIKIYFI